MSEVPGQPPLRIGDAERDAAVERLQRALGEGRITASEFDERVGIALQARTQHDLDPLFCDLPSVGTDARALVPEHTGSSIPASSGAVQRGRRVWTMQALMWPVVILAVCASDFRLWWLLLVPAVLGPLMFGESRRSARTERRELRQDFRDERRELRDRRRDQR